ncbi:MAG: hypothetical protein F9K16_04885 [Thermoanaerobaculia bacterium]|nr:MAG: hypothetical protein F9K16_04885 [Thermoanaerobaculia bacterium]MBZ0103712.1 hypothetical protein [Thermoanaerobaculia bacterium]
MKKLVLPVVLGLALLSPAARAGDRPSATYRSDVKVVKFDVSPPLSSLPLLEPRDAPGALLMADPPSHLEGELGPQDVDGALQDWAGPSMLIPAPLVSFNGPPNVSGVAPPDPVGDVGPAHYVAMSNLSFQIFDKTGTSLLGPAANNTLWAGFGGACEAENSGDPIVLHDQIADRWLLTQFTSAGPTYYNCVALSTTSSPTGSYYRWAVSTGANFPDYPKYGVWSDTYFISTREFAGSSFAGVGAYAMNRSEMLAGNPAPTIVAFLMTPGGAGAANLGDGLLPADLDGVTLPPAGMPGIFVGSMDNGGPYGAPQDALTIWEFDVDYGTPVNSSFTLANTVPIAAYDTMFAGCSGRSCIPQPGTAAKVDILSYRQRPMHRAAYRNFGTHQSIVTNQSVEAPGVMAGVRWWEIRDPAGTPVIHQQGTFAPADGVHRWMASIAQDSAGNMGLGYSASNATSVFPSSWYTGRLAGDPLGTMPQGEEAIIDGTGSQTGGGSRWGDYTSMNVDPVDDCTFWYVNEWVPTTSSAGWQLRIGSFRFNECGTPDFYLGAAPASQTICAGDNADIAVTVGSIGGFSNTVTLGATGNPAGTTAVFDDNTITPPGAATLTIGNTGAVTAGTYLIGVDGTATGSGGHSTSADLVVLTDVPGAATLTSPANGATGVPTAPTLTWTAAAGATGYLVEVDDNADFSSPEFSATVAGTSTGATGLAADTLYNWRVTADNACGTTPSTVFTFTTALEYCATPNLPIPDNGAPVTSTIVVPAGGGNVSDLDLYIRANHTWVGDVLFGLSKNGGANQLHFDRPGVPASTFGCSSDGPDITLDDESATPVETACPSPFVGTFSPNVPLSFFDGQSISGSWTLSADDNVGGDSGSLLEWCLVPTVDVVDPMPFLADFEEGDFSEWSATQP